MNREEKIIQDQMAMIDRRARTLDVLYVVAEERSRQYKKWGTQNHNWPEWISILTEEVGEAAQAAVETHWRGADVAHLREELIQVAAVACQMVEAIDALEKE